MSRRKRAILIAIPVLIILVVGGGLLAFSQYGNDQPPPPTLEASTPAVSDDASSSSSATSGAGALAPVKGDGTFVGYRVQETFAALGDKTAVGRTGDVTGSVTVDGDSISAADLKANLTTLVSDESRRDQAIKGRGIETDRFPTATFVLSDPVELSADGVQAKGKLTLHGVTKEITATIAGQKSGDGVEVAGTAPISFADFDVDPPSIGGFVTVQDRGVLEFKLALAAA